MREIFDSSSKEILISRSNAAASGLFPRFRACPDESGGARGVKCTNHIKKGGK
jgi:hypothetical protein